jgi:hypothetical protein
VFYVFAGTTAFETAAGDVDVGPGGAVRFAPGEYGTVTTLRDHPPCGGRTTHRLDSLDDGAGTRVAGCERCGTETGRRTLADQRVPTPAGREAAGDAP